MKSLGTCFLIFLVLASCNSNQANAVQETESSTKEIAKEVGTSEVVSKEAFRQMMAELKDFTLVDVRTPKEFASGHIEGAINIDVRNENFLEDMSKLDKNKPLLIYCQAGSRSGRAVQQIVDLKFEKVFDLKGGYGGWMQ